jgi:hypothetical protein
MNMRRVYVGAIFLLGALVSAGFLLTRATVEVRGQGDAPKYTIKEVMTKAHGKNNLVKKLALGTATEEDKKNLIEYYEALTKNKPPRGDLNAWTQRTETLLAAAKVAVKGNKADFPRLRKAVDCDTCHAQHKPPDD